jgi:hypothetical protein
VGIPEHISRLRAAVGHDLILLPSVITSGLTAPADGELTEVAWFHPGQLPDLQLNRFARALLAATGYL